MLTDSIRQQITEFLAERHPEVFIIDMQMHVGSRTSLSLRIDNDRGIKLEEIGKLTKDLGPWLDDSEFFEFDHGLEVSSPGATEPLKIKRQYLKHIGRELFIHITDGQEMIGILEETSEDHIKIRPRLKKKVVKGRPIRYEEEAIELPFSNIERAIVNI
ncbi:MAG: hypothetical protein AB8F95_12520 [Bacteroidia bacterium]